jgi:Glycosyltransferases involved in cell wall biogenesis
LINDASIDDTQVIINKLKINKNIKILKNSFNKGQSYSIYKGIKNSSNKIIVTLDGDGQNDPKDIPKLLELFLSNENVEMIGGIRQKRKDNIIKIISSKLANYVRSKILNDDCLDTGCSLKVFSRNIFLKFPYFDGIHRFLPALFKGYGHKTMFINVNHRERKYGFSKYGTMNRLFKGIRDIIKVIKIINNI